jgi:drug/metabolite transporter (DMT)-like permease
LHSLIPRTSHGRGVAAAFIGVLIISFDALLVRLAGASAWDIVFWRGLLIFVSLALYQSLRGEPRRRNASRGERIAFWLVIFIFGVDVALFVQSVANTRAANTVVILTAAPFFAAVFSWAFLRERVPLRTWCAIAFAAAGVILVFSAGARLGTAVGDLYALMLACFTGAALTLLRRYPGIRRVPTVCGSGLVAALLALPFSDPLSLELPSYVVLGVMGLVQMPLAMVLLATATRYLPSPEVSLFLLVETVLGPIWVWAAVGEEPPELTVYGGIAILAAVMLNSWLGLRAGRATPVSVQPTR